MNNSTIQNNFHGREASLSQTLKIYQKQKYNFRKSNSKYYRNFKLQLDNNIGCKSTVQAFREKKITTYN